MIKLPKSVVAWIIGITAIIALVPSGVLFYKLYKLEELNKSLVAQTTLTHKHLTESLQRAETVRADDYSQLAQFALDNSLDIDQIREDLESVGAELEAVASTAASTKTIVIREQPSDSSTPSDVEVPECPEDGRPIDVHGYTQRVETKQLSDSNGMRVADVSFSAARENPWNTRVYGINYRINNTIGRTRNGEIVLHTELLAENPEINPGHQYRISGVESRILQAPEPGPEFDLWDPALFLQAELGLGVWPGITFSASISLGATIMSYGNWRFIGLSAGLDAFQRTFHASFIPFTYNVAAHGSDFLSDIWIFPYVGIDHRSEVSVGVGIGTRL